MAQKIIVMKQILVMVLGVVLGACLSVAIPACADDEPVAKKEQGSDDFGSSNGQNSSNDGGWECNCGTRRVSSSIRYAGDGKVSYKALNDYDDQGRVIKAYIESYLSNTNVYYLLYTNTITYTYPTNNKRVSVDQIIQYNEYGKQTSISTTRTEEVFYDK